MTVFKLFLLALYFLIPTIPTGLIFSSPSGGVHLAGQPADHQRAVEVH